MKIVTKSPTMYELYRCERNDSNKESYDVIDDNGQVLKHCDYRFQAEQYIKDHEPKSFYSKVGSW